MAQISGHRKRKSNQVSLHFLGRLQEGGYSVEVYVWFWEKNHVAVLRLERICVSESESAIGWDGKRDSAIVFS
jgi:hypothetical protein